MSEQVLDAGFRGQAADLDFSPDHVARVVAWLVSEEAADVTGRVVHAAAGACVSTRPRGLPIRSW